MARTPSLTLLDPGRRAYLAQREKEAQKANARKYPIPWRGKTEELTIVRVPSTWALYNIDNGRTAAEQQAYAAKKSKPDLFDDPRHESAQKAQHEILKTLDSRAFEDLLNDIKSRGQQLPGILTASGVLLNGNRRVAACRDAGIEYVDVLILDASATPRELHDLEVELQMAREFKEEYSPVNRLLVIRRMENDGHTPEEIADLLRESGGAKKVRQDVAVFALMEELVAEIDDKDFYLASLDATYQVFTELQDDIAQLEGQQRSSDAAKLKSARFLAIKAGVGYREARHIDHAFFEQYLQQELEEDPLLKELVARASAPGETVTAGGGTSAGAPGSSSSPSGADLGALGALIDPPAADPARQVLKALPKKGVSPVSGGAPAETIASRLRAAIEVASQTAKDAKSAASAGEVPLEKARSALRALEKIDIQRAMNSGGFDSRQVKATLDKLKARVDQLLAALQK